MRRKEQLGTIEVAPRLIRALPSVACIIGANVSFTQTAHQANLPRECFPEDIRVATNDTFADGGRTVHLRQVDKGTGTFQTLGPGRLRCARGTSLCRFVSCLSTHTVVSALSVCTMVKWLRFFLRNGHCERQAQGASDPQAASENKARSQRRHGWVIWSPGSSPEFTNDELSNKLSCICP